MEDQDKHITGKTRSVGFQVGARRTFPLPHEEAWKLLTSQQGLRVWLGEVPNLKVAVGSRYQLVDGSRGEIRVVSPNSHMRLTWQPPGWNRPTTIQVRVISSAEKTVIAFHQEHLPGPEERAKRRAFYLSALDELEGLVKSA